MTEQPSTRSRTDSSAKQIGKKGKKENSWLLTLRVDSSGSPRFLWTHTRSNEKTRVFLLFNTVRVSHASKEKRPEEAERRIKEIEGHEPARLRWLLMRRYNNELLMSGL